MTSITADTQAALDLLRRFSEGNLGKSFKITSSVRTCQQQNSLYAQGRSAPGQIVTNAQGCMSWHVLGRAVDIAIEGGTDADYRALGAYWQSLGGVWGGTFTGFYDPVHFEWHPGTKIEQVCNINDCESGRSISYNVAKVFPSAAPRHLGAIAIAGAMFGGYLLWSRYR